MSDPTDIAKRAALLLERADQLRAEARKALEPIYTARGGFLGASDPLSSLMQYELPKASEQVRRSKLLTAALMRAGREVQEGGVDILVVPTRRGAKVR